MNNTSNNSCNNNNTPLVHRVPHPPHRLLQRRFLRRQVWGQGPLQLLHPLGHPLPMDFHPVYLQVCPHSGFLVHSGFQVAQPDCPLYYLGDPEAPQIYPLKYLESTPCIHGSFLEDFLVVLIYQNFCFHFENQREFAQPSALVNCLNWSKLSRRTSMLWELKEKSLPKILTCQKHRSKSGSKIVERNTNVSSRKTNSNNNSNNKNPLQIKTTTITTARLIVETALSVRAVTAELAVWLQ